MVETKRTRRKRQKWQIGDYFLIPLLNGEFVIGQIIGRIAKALNSIVCVYFDAKVKDVEEAHKKIKKLSEKDVISALFTTRDALDWIGPNKWKSFYNDKPLSMDLFFDVEKLEKTLVGVSIEGSGNVDALLNAFYGLSPWDDCYKPDYYDELLVSLDKKPKNLLYKKDFD